MSQRSTAPAIFTRNHAQYLVDAARRNAKAASRLTTFRSYITWRKADELLSLQGPMPVYMAVLGEENLIRYTAVLRRLDLNPRPSRSSTQQLLKHSLPSTADERVWKPGQGTLYAFSDCRAVPPFPVTSLRKLSDGTSIDPAYRYSYAIVQARHRDESKSFQFGVDTQDPSPADRKTYAVSRVVRDSALVRRLKAHHRNRCQVCGQALAMENGQTYAEAHHLQPLGRPHNGPDAAANILVVCPNHHAMLDLGGIALGDRNLRPTTAHKVATRYRRYHDRVVVGA